MLRNVILILLSVIVAVGLFDGCLRVYEKYFQPAVVLTGGPTVDLVSMSYNDSVLPRQKDPNEFRALSFGDSFAFSIVKYPYSYHGVAAEILNRASSGRKIRIVNLGEPAVSFYQYIKGYRYWGSVFEHDAAIFNIYLGNDLLDISYNWVSKDVELNRRFARGTLNFATGKPMTPRIPKRYPLRFLDYIKAYYLTKSGKVRIHVWDSMEDNPYNPAYTINTEEKLLETNKKQLENFDPDYVDKLIEGYKGLALLAREAARIRKQGTDVLFLLSPNGAQVDPWVRKRLEEVYGVDYSRYDMGLSAYLATEIIRSTDPEIPVVNLIDSFLCASAEGQELYPKDNTHWSLAGNRLAGENLAYQMYRNWLRGHLRDPDGLQKCTTDAPSSSATERQYALRQSLLVGKIAPMLRTVGLTLP